MIVCWSAKGAAGTTTFVASWALSLTRPVLAVDLAGELATVFGVDVGDAPGVLDWLASDAEPSQLDALGREIAGAITLLPVGDRSHDRADIPARRWELLDRALAGDSRAVIIDAGHAPPPACSAEHRWLVTRPCYLALSAGAAHPARPNGVVVVGEPGRSLGRHDIEAAVGAPVVVELMADPAVARAVDSGLLTKRLPWHMRRAMRSTAA